MHIQEIITYTIVTAAISFTLYSFLRVLFPGKKEISHGCSSNCKCDAVKLRKELLANKMKNIKS